jgi:hypothetical protein
MPRAPADFPLVYRSRPAWDTYASLLAFAETIRLDTLDLKPRDMIDLSVVHLGSGI